MKLLRAQLRLWPTNRSNAMSSSLSFDIRTTYSNSSLRCINVTKQIANVTSEKSETGDINKMSFDSGVDFSQDSGLNEQELVNLVEESKGKVKYSSFYMRM